MNVQPAESERGFTMVEVLVAAFLLLVALVAVGSSLNHSGGVNTSARDHARAAFVAQTHLERLLAQGYDVLPTGGDLDANVTGFNQTVDEDDDGQNDFIVRWFVQDNQPVSGSKLIMVRVGPLHSASGVDQRERLVTFATYLARRGT